MSKQQVLSSVVIFWIDLTLCVSNREVDGRKVSCTEKRKTQICSWAFAVCQPEDLWGLNGKETVLVV